MRARVRGCAGARVRGCAGARVRGRARGRVGAYARGCAWVGVWVRRRAALDREKMPWAPQALALPRGVHAHLPVIPSRIHESGEDGHPSDEAHMYDHGCVHHTRPAPLAVGGPLSCRVSHLVESRAWGRPSK